jgi:cytochrome c oxidase cbb3-type subunit 2
MSHPSHNAGDDRGHYHEEFTPQNSAWIGAVLAVGATYVFFLIFAQFGFLKIVQAVVGEQGRLLKPIMATMCAAGLAGSAWAAVAFRENRSLRRMVALFALCGAAASLSLVAHSAAVLFLIAVLTGFGTGGLTVTLAATLRRVTGGDRLGTAVGLGTGGAYAFCNLPFVFNASRDAQSFFALAASCVGILAVQMLDLRAPRQVPNTFDYEKPGILAWVTIFLALVWLDSGAFYIIQHSPYLKEMTWGSGRLYANAAIHFAAAMLAGYMLDRRWVGRTVLVAAGMLVTACVLIGPDREKLTEGVLLYTAAVSIYSTALVFYPARGSRVQLAAIIYGAAGWIGSALGIGMVQDMHAIPRWFVLAASGVMVVGLLGRGWMNRRATRRAAAGLSVIALAAFTTPDSRAASPEAGRQVFIAEGCINCHSQYVRPLAQDEPRWGPASDVAEVLAGEPPLIGNRRQGPDLARVATRRTREWNRLHLIAPREITPGSRMPAYRRLFAADAREGEALLDYLDALGSDALAQRWFEAQHWTPAASANVRPEDAAPLFAQWCASCHGSAGRGDGALATRLSMPPRDLTRGAFSGVTAAGGAGDAEERLALARTIKFGLPGTPMAGREYLRDDEVVALAAYVQALRRAGN